jgi:hypothetical protein
MNGANRFVGGVSRLRLLKTGAFVTGMGLAGGGTASAVARPSDWDDGSLREQLNVVREATAPYKRLAAMNPAGYVSPNLPPICNEGLHFDDLSLWEDGVLDPEHPESLFYMVNDEGEPLDGKPLEGTPEADGWHLIPDPATGFAIWDLHVWVHERNPAGVFGLPNPRYADMPGCVPLEELI